MASQNLTQFDAVLKEHYLPPIIDALPEKVQLYDLMQKDGESWTGNKVIQPIRVVRNQGGGARGDGGTMPTAGRQTYQEHQITAKYNYQRIQVTGPVMAASANNSGAFAKAVASEIKYATLDLMNDVDRQFAADGTGSIGIVETAGSVVNLELDYAGASAGAISAAPGSRFTKAGMEVNIGTTAQHDAATAENVTITSVTDRDTIVIPTTTVADGDILVRAGATAVLASAYNKEIQGLTAAMITTGSYQNINVGTYPNWQANVLTNPDGAGTNRTLTWELMQQAIDEPEENASATIDCIATQIHMRKEYLDMILNDKRYMGPRNLDAGHVGDLNFNGIPIKFCRNFPYSSWMFMDKSTWTYFPQGTINWMDDDGAILSRVLNADAFEALLRMYSNIGCDNPSANTWLKDIRMTLRAT